MSIFAIIQQVPTGPRGALAPMVEGTYPGRVYKLAEGSWLVSAAGTAVEVSNSLSITDGDYGTAVVIEMASYYGRANPAIWTWIKTHLESRTFG